MAASDVACYGQHWNKWSDPEHMGCGVDADVTLSQYSNAERERLHKRIDVYVAAQKARNREGSSKPAKSGSGGDSLLGFFTGTHKDSAQRKSSLNAMIM